MKIHDISQEVFTCQVYPGDPIPERFLEGLRLGEVAEGMYFLSAAPLALGGSDGGPCRTILVEM